MIRQFYSHMSDDEYEGYAAEAREEEGTRRRCEDEAAEDRREMEAEFRHYHATELRLEACRF